MTDSAPTPDRRRLRRIAASIVAWFAEHARDLPWRVERSGYSALVAEAMLQQTQVARVTDRFRVFMERFPTVEALASAPEQDVMASWNGLGYYRRARHLRRAAQVIVSDFDGVVPRDPETLQTLPGVGRYTAGSIASIVYGCNTPIVDTNVARVLSRVFLVDEEPDAHTRERTLWQLADRLVQATTSPGALNEGLMELGALVCTPRDPACDVCPLARQCAARREGRQAEFPRGSSATERSTVHHHAALIRRADGRVLIAQRPAGGMWAEMWQPPTVESPHRLAGGQVKSRIEPALLRCVRCGGFEHTTTHRQIVFHVFTATMHGPLPRGNGFRWVRPAELDGLPVSNAHMRIFAEFGHLA